ncbi:hypothetical protein LguiB_026157 [Lonicera macranthoides]
MLSASGNFVSLTLSLYSPSALVAVDPYRCFGNNNQFPLNSLPNPRNLTLLGFGNVNTITTVVTILLNLLNVLVCKLSQFHESISGVRSTVSGKLGGRFSLAEILSATNHFVESLVIGRGGFEKVHKGSIENGVANCTVTMKRLNSMYKQRAPGFWIDITMPSKFRHSHCVDGTIADQILYKIGNNNVPLYWFWLLSLKICMVCICTARGLDYLHIGLVSNIEIFCWMIIGQLTFWISKCQK